MEGQFKRRTMTANQIEWEMQRSPPTCFLVAPCDAGESRFQSKGGMGFLTERLFK
jgi:hypothetical protein